MNYATIKNCDIANGPGVRVSLFVSGCTHRCPGCFNADTWDFAYGDPFTPEVEAELLGLMEPDYICGLSLLGGEPFEPANQRALLPFLKKVKERFPQKTIWCYSGFTFENQLFPGKVGNPETCLRLLKNLDVLVDGTFQEALKNPALLFRGSSNQHIIDVRKSLESGTMVLLEGKWERSMGSSDIYEN